MIYPKTERNTETIDFEGKKYCAYCGKEITPDIGWDHYEKTEYFHCDCSDALEQIRIEDEIHKISMKLYDLKKCLPKAKFKVETQKIFKKID